MREEQARWSEQSQRHKRAKYLQPPTPRSSRRWNEVKPEPVEYIENDKSRQHVQTREHHGERKPLSRHQELVETRSDKQSVSHRLVVVDQSGHADETAGQRRADEATPDLASTTHDVWHHVLGKTVTRHAIQMALKMPLLPNCSM